MRHNLPDADSPKAQLSSYHYVKFCQQAHEVPLAKNGFCGRFSVVRRGSALELVMRNSEQDSAECFLCGLLKQLLKEGVGFAEKKWIKELHLGHITFHKSETKVYEDSFFAEKFQDLESHRSTQMAASSAHTLLKVEGRIPKYMP